MLALTAGGLIDEICQASSQSPQVKLGHNVDAAAGIQVGFADLVDQQLHL